MPSKFRSLTTDQIIDLPRDHKFRIYDLESKSLSKAIYWIFDLIWHIDKLKSNDKLIIYTEGSYFEYNLNTDKWKEVRYARGKKY